MLSDTLTLDQIQSMSDDEIRDRLHDLRALINLKRFRKEPSMREEIDFCYLTRELELRDERRVFESCKEIF